MYKQEQISEPLATILYRTVEGDPVRLEVPVKVKDLLEQTERRAQAQGRQARRRHIEYVDGLTDTTTTLPQEDFSDILYRMENYRQLYDAMEALSLIQQRRVLLYYFRGLTYREIAYHEHVNHKTVSRSVEQARRKLYSLMAKKRSL